MNFIPEPLDKKKCRVCSLKQLAYNEELCRNVCGRCGAMEELSNIGVYEYGFNTGINYRGLQTVRIPRKRKMNPTSEMKSHVEKMKPFKLEDMFHWIYDLQIEAMRRFVTDFEQFKKIADCLWERYMQKTGARFDIKNAKLNDIKSMNYPLGWGASLDPNKVEETLNIVPTVYRKLCKDEDMDQEIDRERMLNFKKNTKKVKIEKMVKTKLNEKNGHFDKSSKFNETKSKETDEEADSEESELSDEMNISYVRMYKLEGKELSISRVMRKKRECHIRFFGGRVRTEQLLMENNLLLLYYTLHFTLVGTEQCCCLMDIWRLAHNEDIPFLKMARFLPVDRFFIKHTVFQSMILRDTMPQYEDLRHYALYLAETMNFQSFIKPNTNKLIARIVKENNLPTRLTNFVYYIRSLVDPKIVKYYDLKEGSSLVNVNDQWVRFKLHNQHILFSEVVSLAYIFIAMRMIMRLDGKFEKCVSFLAREVQSSGVCDSVSMHGDRMFLWTDWMKGQQRPLTITTFTTWRDLGRVTSAKHFLQEAEQCPEGKYVDKLPKNNFVNVVGRFVQPYKSGTHDSDIEDMAQPLEEAMAQLTASDTAPPPQTVTDYTMSSIEYLEAPDRLRAAVERRHSKIVAGSALDRLLALVESQPLKWRDWPLNDVRYPRGVFAEAIDEDDIKESEVDLLTVLTQNNCVSYDLLYDAVNNLSKLMMKQ